MNFDQLLAEDNLDAENDDFWRMNWPCIAWAKVPLETKVAAYHMLRLHGLVNINDLEVEWLYEMVRADRAFVAALDLDTDTMHCYRLCTMWLDDNVAALANYAQEMPGYKLFSWPSHAKYDATKVILRLTLMELNAPRCIRFLLQDALLREATMRDRMSPLAQRIAEELVQSTDRLDSDKLIYYGQSVKLVGMCVKDEELVAAWIELLHPYPLKYRGEMSVPFVRKLHALATPEQHETIKSKLKSSGQYLGGDSKDHCFELAWLFGLVGPVYPVVQEHFRRNNVSLFPALTFAIIVAMCDGYLEVSQTLGITASQKRFFTLVTRLPMDLQALVSLRLWGRTAIVIQGEQFDRAFLAIS